MIRFRISNSLRAKLLYYFIFSMAFTVVSFSIILTLSLTLQDIADKRFEDEQSLHILQVQLDEIQEPIESYLSFYSSSSLAQLSLCIGNHKRDSPDRRIIKDDESELMKRDIYFLIDSYLLQVDKLIEMKRGRNVPDIPRV